MFLLEKFKHRNAIIIAIITSALATISALVIKYYSTNIEVKKELKIQEIKANKEIENQNKEVVPNNKEYVLFKAIINDPDGYTNVRSQPLKESEVVDKILIDQKFDVIGIEGKWYKVKSPNNIVGYMFYDRVEKL